MNCNTNATPLLSSVLMSLLLAPAVLAAPANSPTAATGVETVRLFMSERITKKYDKKQTNPSALESSPMGTFIINAYYPPRVAKETKRSVLTQSSERSAYPRVHYTCDQHSPSTLQSKASYYEPVIQQASRAYGVNPNLVKAVITAETCFRPTAISPKGAKGLMQLMPATARRFGVTNRGDVWQNVHGGTMYLRWLLNRYAGSVPHAVAAYNSGEGTVDRYGLGVPYRETQNYTRQVLNAYKKLVNPTAYTSAKTFTRQPSRQAQVYNGALQTLSCKMAPRTLYHTTTATSNRFVRAFYYTTVQGDTVHSIAASTGGKASEISAYNRLNQASLPAGIRIKVAQCQL